MVQSVIFADRELLRFGEAVFTAHGLKLADAKLVAEGLVEADLRGLPSHGVARIPIYAERLRRGLVKPQPAITVKRVTPVVASVDGDDGMGFIVGKRAMEEAIAMARELGIGLAGVRRSTHYGMAALYVLQAIEAGFISLAFTSSSPAIPVWGGRSKFLGAAPFAAGAPGGKLGPYVLDMAMTVVARGKIRLAAQRGDPIPEGLALDAEGRPTTDAKKAFEGVCLPFGGHKGAALSMLMEVLGGVLTGAALAGEVVNPYLDFSGPQNVGHFFMAIKPDLFMPRDEYEARMDTLVERVKACPRAHGFDEILMPGEPESRAKEERLKRGIPLTIDIVAALREEAEKSRVAEPSPLDRCR
ncbi:Ldh family oxidoreductase [Shumkonia mesophila]|uniref:Ldh family oxidoreductase n=1 Tax=Shumkonia mesophila TaxID=2838854 RepID=UPI0029341A25|nr:Ldh family oxidoreductase [Shumkonia mesophila]